MKVNELNKRVTVAIYDALHAESGGEAEKIKQAFAHVSALEGELASYLPAGGVEGDIAREGAVRAALKSEDPQRARELAEKYLAEEISEDTKETLLELTRNAQEKMVVS